MGLRAGLDAMSKRKILSPSRESNRGLLARSLVAISTELSRLLLIDPFLVYSTTLLQLHTHHIPPIIELQLGSGEKKKSHSCPCRELNSGRRARILVTILTELPLLLRRGRDERKIKGRSMKDRKIKIKREDGLLTVRLFNDAVSNAEFI
jgi:hypothetical protein